MPFPSTQYGQFSELRENAKRGRESHIFDSVAYAHRPSLSIYDPVTSKFASSLRDSTSSSLPNTPRTQEARRRGELPQYMRTTSASRLRSKEAQLRAESPYTTVRSKEAKLRAESPYTTLRNKIQSSSKKSSTSSLPPLPNDLVKSIRHPSYDRQANKYNTLTYKGRQEHSYQNDHPLKSYTRDHSSLNTRTLKSYRNIDTPQREQKLAAPIKQDTSSHTNYAKNVYKKGHLQEHLCKMQNMNPKDQEIYNAFKKDTMQYEDTRSIVQRLNPIDQQRVQEYYTNLKKRPMNLQDLLESNDDYHIQNDSFLSIYAQDNTIPKDSNIYLHTSRQVTSFGRQSFYTLKCIIHWFWILITEIWGLLNSSIDTFPTFITRVRYIYNRLYNEIFSTPSHVETPQPVEHRRNTKSMRCSLDKHRNEKYDDILNHSRYSGKGLGNSSVQYFMAHSIDKTKNFLENNTFGFRDTLRTLFKMINWLMLVISIPIGIIFVLKQIYLNYEEIDHAVM